MNITPSNPNRPAAGHASEAGASARPEPSATPAPKGSGGSSGGVELSAGAQAFLKVRSRLESLPASAHEERIATLKAAVESGSYQVSGQDVASAMLKDPATKSALGLGRR